MTGRAPGRNIINLNVSSSLTGLTSIKEGWEMGSGKSVQNSAMGKLLVITLLYPLLALSSSASWGYRDLTLVDHEVFFQNS